MLVLKLPPKQQQVIESALHKAGRYEVGGVLMAEHTGPNEFVIRELTVHRRGSFMRFIRTIESAVQKLRSFFDASGHDYMRFNYIGEWHSHPSFEPVPSGPDDQSMLQIVADPNVGANFAVLLIVKLDTAGQFTGTVHTYLPDGTRHRTTLVFADR